MAALSGAALLLSATGYARAVGDRPNVVIFFLDDSGYGDYSHNGNPTIHTPNITKMVQEGMNFSPPGPFW